MKKRIIRIFGLVGLGLVFLALWLVNFHRVMGLAENKDSCSVTHFYADSADVPVFGAEDIEIDHGAGLAFISAFNVSRIAKEFAAGGPVTTQGAVYLWDMRANPPGKEPIPVRDISAQLQAEGQFRPHGISMIKTMDGYRLGIVNHAYPVRDEGPTHVGEVLIADYRDETLQLAASIRNDQMCSPNDLALVDDRRFFVSNDHGACDAGAKKTEELLGLAHAYVLYYDGEAMRRVASDIAYANGVSIAPDGGDTLFVSATRGNRVLMYDSARLMQGDLHGAVRDIDLPFSPDNITWDAGGNMVVSGFSNLYHFLGSRAGMPGFVRTPAAAMRVGGGGRDASLSWPLFADSSGMIMGATVTAIYQDKVIATSVFDDRVLICDAPAS